jgi:hypothetical protein
VKDNELFQRKKNDNANAYMLMYIKSDCLEEVINPLDIEECPQILRNYFDQEEEKENLLDELSEIKKEDKIYLISDQTIHGWNSFGVFPKLDYLQEEVPLLRNPNFRLKI